jgi:hypothetical protein
MFGHGSMTRNLSLLTGARIRVDAMEILTLRQR